MQFVPAKGDFWSSARAPMRFWRSLSLTRQFTGAAVLIVGGAMLILGAWVSRQITTGVIQNTGASTALYINSFIEPLAQELPSSAGLSAESRRKIDELIQGTPIGRSVINLKIWDHDGSILYSTADGEEGVAFPISAALAKALAGQVVTQFEPADGDGDEAMVVPLMRSSMVEIYAPVRRTGAETVIAVAEIYALGEQLQGELDKARLRTWLVVGALTLAMLTMLYGIVHRGGRIIAGQRQALEGRVSELSALLDENGQLRATVDAAHQRAAKSTEDFMRRVGSDLHDGPAQLVGLALLHLEELGPAVAKAGSEDARAAADTIGNLLSGSLSEIRSLAAGLAPPELDNMDLAEALYLAARNHEWRTSTTVECRIGALCPSVPALLKISLYRFAQEGLNNAFKHAGGKEQAIRATCLNQRLMVEVSDAGPGLPVSGEASPPGSLGLSNMRHRIESLGGQFEINSQPGAGARVRATFVLPKQGADHVDNPSRGD